MKKIISYVVLLIIALGCAQTHAAFINFGSTWSTSLNSSAMGISGVSATAGTNAAVSFVATPSGASSVAGGLYNSVTNMALGATVGDSITLKFTATFGVGGVATNLDLKFSFGLAGANDKLFALLDSGLAAGTRVRLGGYADEPNNVIAGYLYRGDLGASVTNASTTTYTGGFTNGPDMTPGTYTLSLTRTATGADLVVSQTKPTGDNWTSTTRTLTTAQADAIALDKFFIGLSGTVPSNNYAFAVSDLSLTVIPDPPVYYTLTVNSGTGGGVYTNGQQVAIHAAAPIAGTAFVQWTGDTQYVASVTASNTTVTMPSNAVTLTAAYTLPKPAGLTVLKNWNFNGDGAVGGTVDSGTSGTDWVKNSADSVLSQFNGGTTGVAFTNDSNLYVDTDAGTLIYQSPNIGENSKVKLMFGAAKTAGFYDMRAKGEQIATTGSGVFSGTVNFLSTNSTVLAQVVLRKTDQMQFVTYVGGVTNAYEVTGGAGNEVVTSFNSYQVAWKDKTISFYFDDEARGGGGATNWIDLAIDNDVAGIQLSVTTSGTSGKVTVDRMNIEVISSGSSELTVNSGSGDGTYTNGAIVEIAADAPALGKTFDQWTGDTQYVASVTSSNTTVTMPAQAVALTATYKDLVCTLTGNAGSNGTVTPASTNVVYGSNVDFVVTASNYYRIVSLTTNGTAVTGLSFDNGSTTANFTWTSVLADGTLAATFTAQVANDPAGTPYSWLAGFGLTNYDTDAVADQDLDGLKAWQEYIAGTDPTNKASCLKLAQTNRNTVTWSPVAGRVYSVYWSTNLLKGFTNLASGITYPQSSYTNTTPDAKVNHYQVKVQLQ